jgi:UDP-N-acetylglucosamine 2-epimerase (non-hydrolysing)
MERVRARILLVAGTRPECLKLASVAKALRHQRAGAVTLMNSGQHQQMVDRSLKQLNLAADIRAAQCQAASLSATLLSLRGQIRKAAREVKATLLVAQGDTSTAYATALAARDLSVPLAHVEAGLRTNHPLRPFPEEYFRRRIARLTQLHFAPTETAERNLLIEGVSIRQIHRVGNTAIDVLREILSMSAKPDLPPLPLVKKIVTLTLHRRENYGRGLDTVCAAVLELLAAEPDIGIVCPVHPNPIVGARIRRHLADHPRIVLTAPLDYAPFIALLARSTLAITDSGGIQEEAPYLGTPILIVRENTERPESVALGLARLVAVCKPSIVSAARQLCYAPRPAAIPFDTTAPYGDGHAGERVARVMIEFHRADQNISATQPAALFAIQSG